MDKLAVDFLKHQVAKTLMLHHGWDVNDPLHKTEFDPENVHSQYSMMYEDAEIAVEAFMDGLLNLDQADYSSAPSNLDNASRADDHQNPSIQKSVAIFISMDSGKGKPVFVGDVRDWLAEIENAGIPDSTEIEGHLYLSCDIEPAAIISGKDVTTEENYVLLTDPITKGPQTLYQAQKTAFDDSHE